MTPPRLEFIWEQEGVPDPYLFLMMVKQHLADHQPMDQGDIEAWEICDRLQIEVEDYD